MHEKAVAALVERVKKVAEQMVYPDPFPHAGQKIIGGTHPISAFALTDEGDDLRRKLVADHLYAKWSDKFSEKHIEGKITAILLEATERRDTTGVEAGVRGLVAEYEAFDTEYTVVLPLVGVCIGKSTITLGRAILRGYDDVVADDLTGRCRTIIEANPNYTPEWKTKYFEDMDRNYLAELRGSVCSEVTVRAEPNRAKEIALEETRLALDLLRYAILFLYTKDRPRAVGVLGDVSDDHRVSVAIRTDNQGVNFGSEMRNHPLELGDQTIARMRAIGVFDLSDLIVKLDRTEFEDVILRAVHWLASAQAQAENENALLNLVTCLETFFKAEAGTPITATIAEGVALLTATGTEARKRRKGRVAHFYKKRSKLTHEGDGKITTAELLELTLICRDLTMLMIQHRGKFAGHEEFRNWLEDQKLGGAVAFPA
jgi:hypothetical protein